MSKTIKGTKSFKVYEAAPRFLLLLKTRLWRASDEEPAKYSSVIEAFVFLFFVFVVFAILVITYQKVRGG